MKSDFIHLKPMVDGKEYYLDVDKTKGATIILPGVGTIALSKDDVQKIVDFRAGFDYNDVVCRRRKVRNIQPDTVEYNVLNEDTKQLVLVSFIQKTDIDQPEMRFESIDIEDGKTAVSVVLPFTVVDVLLREFAAKEYVSELMPIKDIRYVDKLPNETTAASDVVYLFEKEYYKLNVAEDGFNKLTGDFEHVNVLPEFTPKGKENVLYRLTADYFCPVDKETYSKGVYTFDASTKVFTLTELKFQNVKFLPDLDKADANTLYVLTKADGDKAKGTIWAVKTNAWAEETREVITTTELPIIKIAVPGTFYIVADTQIQKANAKGFDNLGKIVSVKALPDTTKVVVETNVVFVLTKAQGSNKVGDKFTFDGTTKEFVAYTDEVDEIEAGGESLGG